MILEPRAAHPLQANSESMQKPPFNRSHWVFSGDALELNSLRCTCVVRPYHSGAAQAWKLELLYMDGTTDPVTDHLWNPCKRLLCQVSRALINIAFLDDLWFSQFTHLASENAIVRIQELMRNASRLFQMPHWQFILMKVY